MVIFHILKEQEMKFSVLVSISLLFFFFSLTKSNCNILLPLGLSLPQLIIFSSTPSLQMIILPSLLTLIHTISPSQLSKQCPVLA